MKWDIGGTSIAIAPTAEHDIFQHVQFKLQDKEAGGLLLGRDLVAGNSLVIDKITQPFCQEKRTRFTVFRGAKHMDHARKYWKMEDRTGQILGLWHTHPETKPVPSNVDLKDWKKQLKSIKNTPQILLFLIVGTKYMGCWYGILGSKTIQYSCHKKLDRK